MSEQTPIHERGEFAPVNASAVSDANGSNKSNSAVSPKVEVPLSERAAYTPNEFAALFGKQVVWGYRKIYAGQVKVITILGRMMIPASEVKRLQGEAVTYDFSAKQKRPKRKKSVESEASISTVVTAA